jgi:hypothetical protein
MFSDTVRLTEKPEKEMQNSIVDLVSKSGSRFVENPSFSGMKRTFIPDPFNSLVGRLQNS